MTFIKAKLLVHLVGLCSSRHSEIRSRIHVSRKTAKKAVQPKEDELGLWIDTPLLVRVLKQPSQSLFERQGPVSAERLLHFADLALGTKKPHKFKSERV